MMAHATHMRHLEKLTPTQVGQRAIGARLATESWDDMTAAANQSSNHPKSLDRWRRKAAEQNPHLSGEQLDRQAERLRREYYSALATKRHALNRAARQIAASVREVLPPAESAA